MCGPYVSFNKAASDVRNYHVHIYFEAGTAGWAGMTGVTAEEVAATLKKKFPDMVGRISKVAAQGPHTKPNYAISLKPEGFAQVVQFLQLNRNDLSILVHPHTGDEIFDHKEAALWLGEPVALNESFFAAILQQREDKMQSLIDARLAELGQRTPKAARPPKP